MAATGRSSTGPAKRRRVPWGTINRKQIVDAAERAVRTGSYEQLTIRSLAADLGISPMAVYHHVRDKDDLLDEVVDRLLARAWKPKADPGEWRAWVVEAADRLRRLLVGQPAALHVYLAHPVTSPAALARMDSVVAVLRRALENDQTAERAYAALHTYTVGFAALEASRSGWQPPQATAPPPSGTRSSRRHEVQRPISQKPEMVERLAAYTTADQFRHGLIYLLDGIEHDADKLANWVD